MTRKREERDPPLVDEVLGSFTGDDLAEFLLELGTWEATLFNGVVFTPLDEDYEIVPRVSTGGSPTAGRRCSRSGTRTQQSRGTSSGCCPGGRNTWR
jgi:hypothetical protein